MAERHGTNKFHHGYAPHYEAHFGQMAHLPLTVLEIGISEGKSLTMWEEFFPNAFNPQSEFDPPLTPLGQQRLCQFGFRPVRRLQGERSQPLGE